MTLNKKIKYITYQSFPSNKANTLQTFDNIKYMIKKGFNVDLIFPLREIKSSDDIKVLAKYYDFPKNLSVNGRKHKYPFGKSHYFEKILYVISHFLWAREECKRYSFKNDEETLFFTRSEWIFYNLSKKKLNVTLECHQLSKIRKFNIKRSIKYKNAKIIFLNDQLAVDSNIDSLNKKKVISVQNGVDPDLFSKDIDKNPGQIIFVGNLTRFNQNRNLEFIIDCFKNTNLNKKYFLKIIGGPSSEVSRLKQYVIEIGLEGRVFIEDRKDRKLAILEIQKSQFGLLINSSKNEHSVRYTSPLKYFEYIYGGLKVLAVDFESHRNLPFSDNIEFFDENNEESFIKSLNLLENKLEDEIDFSSISLENRVNKILNFVLN